jgi:CRP-like cAMP-binding protein
MNSSMEKDSSRRAGSGFKEDLEYLHQSPLLAALDYECLKLLAMLGKRIDFIDGDQLMVQGEDDGCAYYLISGTLEVLHQRDDITRRIDTFGPGSFIGGLALLGKSVRLFTLQATGKTTALRLKREGFQKTIKQFPESLQKVSASLVTELMRWDRRILSEDQTELAEKVKISGVSLL